MLDPLTLADLAIIGLVLAVALPLGGLVLWLRR